MWTYKTTNRYYAPAPVVSRPRVLLDVDGPLTGGFFEAACDVIRSVIGVPSAYPETITEWDIAASFGLTKEQEHVMYSKLRRQGVASSFQPNPGAVRFVRRLSESADVYAVTAPLKGSPTWAFERESWLREHFEIPAERVVFAHDKRLVQGDVFVDDKVASLVMWRDAHPSGRAVLWEEPHNDAEEWEGLRARTYSELDRIINNGGSL